MAQKIIVSPVTRIEGHARIVLDLDDSGAVAKGHLQVWELRGFEKLLEQTELFKMPQVTARLCGVCPAAHHLVSVIAIENGLGIAVPAEAKLLRELLYAGHILHSHALSNFVLTGPDVMLGLNAHPMARNMFAFMQTDPELARKFLRLRSIGQRTVEIVGGRGVHPVTAIPGGMARRPTAEELDLMAGWGREAIGLMEEVGEVFRRQLALLAELRPIVHIPFHAMALSRGGTVSFLDGDCVVVDPAGQEERRFQAQQYTDHLAEHSVDSSYMKSVKLRGTPEKEFYVGPLARAATNHSIASPTAHEAWQAFRQGWDLPSAVDYLHVRLIEMLHSAERIAAIAGGELTGGPLRVPAEPRAGRCIGLIEAPRGILIHDYTADDNGRVTAANFIVATQNNYDAIDHTITTLARHLLPQGNENMLLNGVEFSLRCYDPCLACATHAAGRMPMEIVLRSEGTEVRRITRRNES